MVDAAIARYGRIDTLGEQCWHRHPLLVGAALATGGRPRPLFLEQRDGDQSHRHIPLHQARAAPHGAAGFGPHHQPLRGHRPGADGRRAPAPTACPRRPFASSPALWRWRSGSGTSASSPSPLGGPSPPRRLPEDVRERLPGPDFVGNGFVMASRLGNGGYGQAASTGGRPPQGVAPSGASSLRASTQEANDMERSDLPLYQRQCLQAGHLLPERERRHGHHPCRGHPDTHLGGERARGPSRGRGRLGVPPALGPLAWLRRAGRVQRQVLRGVHLGRGHRCRDQADTGDVHLSHPLLPSRVGRQAGLHCRPHRWRQVCSQRRCWSETRRDLHVRHRPHRARGAVRGHRRVAHLGEAPVDRGRGLSTSPASISRARKPTCNPSPCRSPTQPS